MWPWLLLLVTLGAQAQSVREQEIAECRPGEIATWNDARDHAAIDSPLQFVYDPAGAPPWFGRAEVYAALEKALAGWAPCGVALQLLPLGQAAPSARTIRVGWSDAGARGNFGLADTGRRSLSLGPAAFRLLRQRNLAHPAGEILQMVLSHETGHFFGLMAHSKRCVDVMSYYDDGQGGRCLLREASQFKSVVEYRSTLPTACDIARCRALNQAGRRSLNSVPSSK